ncbi:tRNA wybutosine-synthesizing protein 5-like [Tachypleus tridentatus]|uniref:tRNA wybutosine-synthesizing protein 5-like n=1 Tax=Tachypleus tridentatus TaxID=6853 RepID=UPI003FD2D901
MKSSNVKVWNGVSSETLINEIYPQRVPAVLKNINIGKCTEKWTAGYLAEQVGNQPVKVHVSTSTKLDFINKNFLYRTLPFNEFIARAAEEKHSNYFLDEKEVYYMRSLGDDPRKDVADIRRQFSGLAKDISYSDIFPEKQFFSSVFRIASKGLCLWTHYDVMDNLLIQVKGKKYAVLFHPNDVSYMYMNGDKSEVLDVENPDLEKYPEFIKATKYTCTLDSGDILFIPALWLHNMTSLEFGVAVNVFWHHLEESMYDKKDPYGNKDPHPAATALTFLEKALKTLKQLPDDYRTFYSKLMISRIQDSIS